MTQKLMSQCGMIAREITWILWLDQLVFVIFSSKNNLMDQFNGYIKMKIWKLVYDMSFSMEFHCEYVNMS